MTTVREATRMGFENGESSECLLIGYARVSTDEQ